MDKYVSVNIYEDLFKRISVEADKCEMDEDDWINHVLYNVITKAERDIK